MKLNKKSQVTVFIILGIILLFSTALIFYIKQQVEKYEPAIGLVQEIPLELQPMHSFITGCLNSLAEEALVKAGLQGGYVDTTTLIVNEQDMTEGEAITLTPGSDLKIPYWWYLKSENTCVGNCQFDTKRLALEGIRSQIEDYIRLKIQNCINYLDDFRDQGFGIEDGPISVDVKFGKETHVVMEYPIKVTKEGSVSSISKFYTSLPLNFMEIYNLASLITNLQIEFNFLENHGMRVISGFSDLNKEIPPISASDFNPGPPKTWFKRNVKQKIQSLLASYTSAIDVYESKNFVERSFEDMYKKGIYTSMVIPVVDANERPFKDLSTDFVYFDSWPFYFNVKGRGVSGEIISAEEAAPMDILSFIGLKRYSIYFDVSYPVLIEIYNSDALKGKGYRFFFALEANIRNNEALKTDYAGLPISPLLPQMFCNEDQKNSGNITFYVNNAFDNSSIVNARIDYSCGEQSCLIGYTNSSGFLVSKLPICAGGFITVSKKDYLGNSLQYNAFLDESDFLNISLYPYKEKTIIVKKKPVYKSCFNLNIEDPHPLGFLNPISGWSREKAEEELQKRFDEIYAGYLSKETQQVDDVEYTCYWKLSKEPFSNLLKNELAIINFKRIKDLPTEKDYSITVMQNGSLPVNVSLVPGNYDVSIQLMYGLPDINNNAQLIITDRKIKIQGAFWEEPKEETIKGAVFDKMLPEGGVKISESNSYWNLTAEKLYNEEAIIFYSLKAPDFVIGNDGVLKDTEGKNMRIEDLGQVGKIGEYTDLLRDILEPVFVAK